MGERDFDYYIFIDYSDTLIGYLIIEKSRVTNLLPLISRLRHYKETDDKDLYLKNVKKTFKRENLLSHFLKHKIRETRQNMDIFLDIGEFIKNHPNCLIFASIDNRQYSNFEHFVKIVDGNNIKVVKESELREGSFEHQLSLVLDNWLNIERLKI